jgi:hypothetical protein
MSEKKSNISSRMRGLLVKNITTAITPTASAIIPMISKNVCGFRSREKIMRYE